MANNRRGQGSSWAVATAEEEEEDLNHHAQNHLEYP
jgi:hypothetical protein